ncbi:uncharacterized protein [Ambystoma mexicanum]|uniref:uncharacterized protein isoform X2 n=1 Tax=Ambystoma mexicanum TaxID=8296 RepID=UPI0037E7734F
MDAPQEEKTHEIPRRNEHTETVVEDILLLIMIIVGLKISVNILILALYKMKSFLGAVTGIFYGERVDTKVNTLPEWMKSGHYKVTDYKHKLPTPSDVKFKYVVEPVKLTLEGYHSGQDYNRHDAAGPYMAHKKHSVMNLWDSEDEQMRKHHRYQEANGYHNRQHHRENADKSNLNFSPKEYYASTGHPHNQLLTDEAHLGHERRKKHIYDIKARPGVIYREVRSDARAQWTPQDTIPPMVRSTSRTHITEIQHHRGKQLATDSVNTLEPSSGHSAPANAPAHLIMADAVNYAYKEMAPPTERLEADSGIGPSSHLNAPQQRVTPTSRVDERKHSPPAIGIRQVPADSVDGHISLMSDQTSEYSGSHGPINPLLRIMSPFKDNGRSQNTKPDIYHNSSLPAPTEYALPGSQSTALPITGVDEMVHTVYIPRRSPVPYGTLDNHGSLAPGHSIAYPPHTSTAKHVFGPLDSAQQTKEDIYPMSSLPTTPGQSFSENQGSVSSSSPNDSHIQIKQNMGRKNTHMRHAMDETLSRSNQFEKFEARDRRPSLDDGTTTKTIRHEIYLVVGESPTKEVKENEYVPKLPPPINTHHYRTSNLPYTSEANTYQKFTPEPNS